MPERPKRRKNNKNKRKNKINRPDINQDNEKTESLSSESCSEHKIEAKLSEDLTVSNEHMNTQISDDNNVQQGPKYDDVEENCSALIKTCLDSNDDNLVVTKETTTEHSVENLLSETCEEIKKELKYGGGDDSEDILSNITNDDDGVLNEIRSNINLSLGNEEPVKNNTKYEECITSSEKINDEKPTSTSEGCINYQNISCPESENIGLGEKQEILKKDCTILTVDNISSSEINKQKGGSNQVIDIEKIQKINKYIVESPDQTLKSKSKLINTAKSKSLDNDDVPKIIDVTEECDYQSEDALVVVDTNNVVISDIDSDVEWEQANELQYNQESELKNVAAGEFSISTLPLNVAKCDETKSLTPEEEISLRHYLQTLNLSTNPSNGDSVEIKAEIEHIISREIKHRLRKKGLTEDFFCQRVNAPRILDVIDEEGSGESSLASRRQSYLSDKKSDAEDLDDVFEENNKVTVKTVRKNDSQGRVALGPLVPQPCLLVDTKIKDPDISEACGNWTVKTLEKMKGAELIYLTDSSSSTSSIHDVSEETDDSADTDLSVRMITPTIEVTDTENLLKKTFLTSDYDTSSIKNNDRNTENLQSTVLNEKHSSYSTKTLNDQNDSTLKNDNSHVIEILQTDNIKTDLYVKDLEETDVDQFKTSNITKNNSNLSSDIDENIVTTQESNDYSCEMKILKCELNDAINNLIKEVVSDSETNNDNENTKDTFVRQDSSSSICSSQCTAKYNPTSTSLNDISNILHDENFENNLKELNKSESISHVKDVFEHVIGISEHNKNQIWAFIRQPLTLKDLSLRKISTLPYGEKILEELANVSKRLQNVTIFGSSSNTNHNITDQDNRKKKEYQQLNNKSRNPLSEVSTTEKVSLHTTHKHLDPPPVKPRNSSLKKPKDEHHWAVYPTKSEPVYICLSPSQKMLMEKTNTIVTKEDASHLVDVHKKPVDRKDYEQGQEYKEPLKPEDNKTPSNSPFKSQTGSRLLALIRDPSVVNSAIKHCDFSKRSLDQLNKSQIRKERVMEQNSERPYIFKDVATFKPIPPPRPRKLSSSIYESDENSDFTDSSFRSISAKKIFHYSTGNLNKEIENDISSIQNMHRYCTNIRDDIGYQKCPRRPSLPKDLCDQQMEYIRQKEKEVEAELRRLEEHNSRLFDQTRQRKGPKAPMLSDKEIFDKKVVDSNNCYNLRKMETLSFSSKPFDMEPRGRLSSLFSSSQEEIIRDKMYSEYVNEMAERQERKQKKVIKITNTSSGFDSKEISKSMPALDILDSKVNNRIEKEFISKARERWNKLGIKDPETEDEKCNEIYKEPKVIEHKIKVIQDGEERDVKKLPNHLQEFVRFTVKEKDQGLRGSPGESKPGPASPHVVILCAVIIIMLTIGKYLMRIFRNK